MCKAMVRKIFFETHKDGWLTKSNAGQASALLAQRNSAFASVLSGSSLYAAPAHGLSNW